MQAARKDQARVTLKVGGMHCASCVSNVEKALLRAPGVTGASVNLATEQAAITFMAGQSNAAALAQAIRDAGYEANPPPEAGAVASPSDHSDHHRGTGAEAARWRARALFGVALALPVAVMGMFWPGYVSGILQAVLTGVLQATLGATFMVGAVKALGRGRADMDTLIALGTTTAFAYSIYTLAAGSPHVFFDTAATILALIAVGKWLEARARSSAAGAVRGLLELTPTTAMVERDGREVEIAARDLVVGDVVVLRPGGRVPADGTVESGDTTVDESLLTGESMPVSKRPGDHVVGGSINVSGAARVRITRVGVDSTIGQVAALVDTALSTKTRYQRLADQIAGVFVPVVLVIALAAAVGWGLGGNWEQGLHCAIAVLIVACPCALGLATPAAVMVGCAVGARRGILIRSAEVLERMGKLDTVVLDKTGTLTVGKPSVHRILLPVGTNGREEELLRLAASVESSSEHPLARAVLRAASERRIGLESVTGFVNEPGGGVRGIVGGREIGVSRLDPSDDPAEARTLRGDGFTLSGVYEQASQRRTLLGVIAFADEVKPGARDAVAELGLMGLKTIMLTGDHEAAARRVAREVGIEHVLSGVTPQTKHESIVQLKREGKRPAMVGDGINDAAALAAADVGIAMGAGADIAKEAGDVVLVSGDPTSIPRAIRLSLAMRRRIRLGLLWAFIYNVALIPAAAAGLLHPMLAAGAMAVSSVSVVANALLLLRFDRR